jgi:HD-like signal output (HDOD) protein
MTSTYIPAFTLEPQRRTVEKNAPAAIRTPRFIDDVAAGRVQLPTIPRVVQSVIKALRDPDVDARKIGDTLSQDPVLSAKVLRVANSSYFGGARSMASIDAAIAMIGMQALNKLIVACGVSSSFTDVPGIDLQVFWRDALVAATAAQKLAAVLAADPDEAYVCGLLHASGHLILCQSYPDIAQAMFAGFEVVRGAELAAIEVEAFGIDHPEVGKLWVQSLGFPLAVADTIGQSSMPPADADGPLTLALRGACLLAAAVAQQAAPGAALAALPPGVRQRFTAATGEPTPGFIALYDTLQKTEPAL